MEIVGWIVTILVLLLAWPVSNILYDLLRSLR